MFAAAVQAQGQGAADLVIAVDNGLPYLSPGQNFTYEITVNNYGPDPVAGAAVADVFPSELTNVTWIADPTIGASSAFGAGTGAIADTVDIGVGERVVYRVSARVDVFATGTVVNTATVTIPAGMQELAPASNTATDSDPIEFQTVSRVQPFYANGSPSPNAFGPSGNTPPSNAFAAFDGHVGDRLPTSGPGGGDPRIMLKTSSFGQPLARFIAGAADIDQVLLDAINQLYYVPGAPSQQNNDAAFRFINTLYNDTGGAVSEIQRRIENGLEFDATIDPNDGQESDEERALRVANDIKPILQAYPHDQSLRNLLLDIYYHRTVGRQIIAKQKVVEAYQLNFSSVVASDVAFGTPINQEIEAYEEAAGFLRDVLNPYIELLTDNFGVDIAGQVDPEYTGNLPFGFYMFREEVPGRSVYASTFVDFDANTGQVSGNPEQVVDDSQQAPVLIVGPTAHHVDPNGVPDGGATNQFTFTIQNVGAGSNGAGDLRWSATVVNPAGASMLDMRIKATDPWATSLTSGNTPIKPPPAGQPVTVTVRVAPNTSSPLQRTGKIEVRDISGGANALAFNVIVVQEGAEGPILAVSASPAILASSGNGFQSLETSIIVRNAGAGTLRWVATPLEDVAENEILVVIAPQSDPNDYDDDSICEADTAIVSVRYTYFDPAPGAYNVISVQQVQDCGADPPVTIGEPIYVSVTAESQAKAVKTSSAGAPLLTVSNDTVAVSSEAAFRSFTVNDAAAVGALTVTTIEPWIALNVANDGSGRVEMSIEENTGTARRDGFVVVRAANTGNQSRVVTVVQDGAADAGLVVNPLQRYIAVAAGQSASGLGFAVQATGGSTSPVDWSARVTKGPEWLRIVSGESGTDDGEILFAYDRNTSLHGRTGEITISAPGAIDGQTEIVVQVVQRGEIGAQVLTGGFKDLILLFDVMRDDAQINKELAKRYALRRLAGDVESAYALIGETLRRHNVAITDLGNLIPDWQDRVPVSSELVATYSGWQQAIEELTTVTDFLNGDSNILGFKENFLFLVQSFQGQDPAIFDSFDKLLLYMFDDANSIAVPTSVLGNAFAKYQEARAEYNTFVETQDELAEEFRTQNLDHRKWMYDVIGVDPGNDVDNPDDAENYYNPSGNYGGEIWQVDRSIERARSQLDLNAAQIGKIMDDVNTEIWRRSQERQINASIADLQIAFGEQVAEIEGIIGGINAAQAVADNLTEAASIDKAILSGGAQTAARITNAVVQAAAEIAKGQLEASKARLAAQESAQVRLLEDEINDVNSQALIANMMGELNLVAMESADLALALIQELGSRQALIDEWHYREDRMRENNAALLGRSFANPVYRLQLRRSMLEAESAFKVAQRWVFFAVRALEYKWNTPFVYNSETGDWSTDSIFRARTARDLVLLTAALRDYDGLLQGSARSDDRFDWFSFKKDFFGLIPEYDANGAEIRNYLMPNGGPAATATEVFRYYLARNYNADTGVIDLDFSTFKDNGLTFFRGPRRDPNDPYTVLSRGQYLDKINWMKVNFVGDFTNAPFDRIGATLTYSGSSYIRNSRVGVVDPVNPTRITDEFTVWPTKFWFYDAGSPASRPPVPGAWRSSDTQSTEIAINLTDLSRYEIPGTVDEIDVFRERSVASDGWKLRVETVRNGIKVVQFDDIDDIEILFYHTSKERPPLKKGVDGEVR